MSATYLSIGRSGLGQQYVRHWVLGPLGRRCTGSVQRPRLLALFNFRRPEAVSIPCLISLPLPRLTRHAGAGGWNLGDINAASRTLMASTGLGSNQQAGASSSAAATHARSHQQPQSQQPQPQQQPPALQQPLQPKLLQQQEQQQHRGSHALVEAWLLSTATGAETPPSAGRSGLPPDPFEQAKQRGAANGAPNALATERRGTWAHEEAPKAAADAKATGVVDLFAGQGRPADSARMGAAAVGAPVAAAAPKQHAGAAPQGYLDLQPPPQQHPVFYQQPSLVASPERPQQQPAQQVPQVGQPQPQAQQQLQPQAQPQPQPQQAAAAATWQPGGTEAAELSRPGGVDAPVLPPTDTNAPFSVQWEYLDTKVRLGKGMRSTHLNPAEPRAVTW